MNKIDLKALTSIDDDFALWAAEQGTLLRDGKLDRLDIDNVAEEIESFGRSGKYEIANRLEALLAHLLKWEFQRQKRSNSWRATIREQRMRIARVLDESPSMKLVPGEEMQGAYIIGLNEAITQTGLPEAAFPASCPYTIEQILDPEFLPGGP